MIIISIIVIIITIIISIADPAANTLAGKEGTFLYPSKLKQRVPNQGEAVRFMCMYVLVFVAFVPKKIRSLLLLYFYEYEEVYIWK